jgi:uncharacterized membrane protein YfcA
MSFGLGWHGVAELLILGSCTGFIAGLLGVGGGMLMVPFVSWLLSSHGVSPEHVVKMAIATSLATICFTSIASLRAHHARGAVLWPVVRLLAPGIVVGSMLGAQIAKALPSPALAVLFALFVSFSAAQMLLDRKPPPARQLPQGAGMFGAGAVLGLLASMVGAGGAFISVPFMTWCNVKMHNAVATSAALGFPIAVAGTIGYVIAGWSLHDMPAGTLGYIYLPALFTLSAASVLTAPLGARTAHRLQMRHLKRGFAVLLFGLATTMIYKAAGN